MVAIEYNNGSKEIITDYVIKGGTKLKAGTQTITIQYGEYSRVIKVDVVKLQVIHLEVTNPPVTIRYLKGTNFELNGLEVKATWNTGTSKIVTNTSGSTPNGTGYTPITNGYTVVDGIALKEGQTSVKLKMDNATVSVPIEVYVHEHTGQAGLSYSNGCYTKAVLIRQYCPGHQHSEVDYYQCRWCGTKSSSNGACPNNVCGSKTSGTDWYTAYKHWTSTCSTPCVKEYRYDLGCGY